MRSATPETYPAISRTEPITTLANLVTVIRTTIAVVLAMVALVQGSLLLVAVGYGVYWIGDMLDGAAARWLDEETRQGAVFDIVSDRVCTCLLAAGFVLHAHGGATALTVFLLQFMVLDSMLTLSFLHWPLLGPNDFHLVDRTVWRLNWSPYAKSANTAAVVLLILVHWYVAATVLALLITAVKVWSLRRVRELVAQGRVMGAQSG